MSKFIEDFRREVVAKWVIQDLESKLPKSFIDFANNVADYASFNVRKLIEKCETFQRLQEVVRKRYSEAQDTLERLARRAPSVKRFCDACTTLNKAIAISIQEGDISVELSECLVTGMKILSETPRKSRCFNKKQRDKIVESSVSFFSSYAEYGKMFYPFVHEMGDFNDLNIDIPPCIKKAKGNSLHERVADIIFGSPSAGKYNFKGVAFEKLAKSLECVALPKHPSAALLHCPLEEWFSREVLYFKNLLSANGIKYVLNDPSRMIVCIEKQIRYCKNKPKVIQALREYNSLETRWGSMLRDAGSDEAKRREYLEKLEKTRSDRDEYKMKCVNDDILDMKEIEELQAQVAPVTDAQQNGNEQGFMRKERDYQLVSDPETQQNTDRPVAQGKLRRPRGQSAFRDGKVTSNFYIKNKGRIIRAGGRDYKVTRQRTWDVIDALLRAAKSTKGGGGWITISGKKLTAFNSSKDAKDFRRNWIATERDSGSNAIGRARLSTACYSQSSCK